jgi:putative ATPase
VKPDEPLAERLRPTRPQDYVGQPDALPFLIAGKTPSVILWGPPGCGKTTFARIIARSTSAVFVPLSAVTATVKDVREVVERATKALKGGRKTILFIDELHRYVRAHARARV